MSAVSAFVADDERIALDINGESVAVHAVLSTTLLTALRDELHLTAAKRGCNQGVCGACTGSIDGEPMRACLSLAHGCTGREVRTLEGGFTFPDGSIICLFCSNDMLLVMH